MPLLAEFLEPLSLGERRCGLFAVHRVQKLGLFLFFTDSEKRITELDAIFKRLYEDNISGKLSDERFQKLSADYEKEEQELKVLVNSLRKEVELEESKSADVDRFLSVVERYTDIPELTPCILHEFVEKIIVHAASDPKGKNRTQEIDIYYKGIGVLEMSKVTASTEK